MQHRNMDVPRAVLSSEVEDVDVGSFIDLDYQEEDENFLTRNNSLDSNAGGGHGSSQDGRLLTRSYSDSAKDSRPPPACHPPLPPSADIMHFDDVHEPSHEANDTMAPIDAAVVSGDDVAMEGTIKGVIEGAEGDADENLSTALCRSGTLQRWSSFGLGDLPGPGWMTTSLNVTSQDLFADDAPQLWRHQQESPDSQELQEPLACLEKLEPEVMDERGPSTPHPNNSDSKLLVPAPATTKVNGGAMPHAERRGARSRSCSAPRAHHTPSNVAPERKALRNVSKGHGENSRSKAKKNKPSPSSPPPLSSSSSKRRTLQATPAAVDNATSNIREDAKGATRKRGDVRHQRGRAGLNDRPKGRNKGKQSPAVAPRPGPGKVDGEVWWSGGSEGSGFKWVWVAGGNKRSGYWSFPRTQPMIAPSKDPEKLKENRECAMQRHAQKRLCGRTNGAEHYPERKEAALERSRKGGRYV